jgi:hypothetical protein
VIEKTIDRIEEEILNDEVSDDAVEAACTGTENRGSVDVCLQRRSVQGLTTRVTKKSPEQSTHLAANRACCLA